MRIIDKIIKFFLLAILLFLGAWIYDQEYLTLYLKKISSKQKPVTSANDFDFKKVMRKDIRQTVLATGTVSLKTGAEVKIGSRISGQLKELHVQIGNFVKAGTIIAVVEHDDLMSRVAQRKAELKAEKAQLEKIRSEGPLETNKINAEIEELEVQIKLAGKMLMRNHELRQQGVVDHLDD